MSLMTTPGAVTGAAPAPARRRQGVEGIYYLFLVPALALFTLAITLPALMGIFFSFTNSIGFGDWDFVGLINYQALFSDPAIWESYLFTLGFAAVTVIVVNVLAFLLAVGLTGNVMGAAIAGIIADLFGWRGIFAVAGLFGLIITVAAFYILRSFPVPKPRPVFNLPAVKANYRSIFADPRAKFCFGSVFFEGIFIHGISTSLHRPLLLARKLAQQIPNNPRVLVRLLLHLTLPDSVERAKEPHFLQVADEHLQVFGGFDLFW